MQQIELTRRTFAAGHPVQKERTVKVRVLADVHDRLAEWAAADGTTIEALGKRLLIDALVQRQERAERPALRIVEQLGQQFHERLAADALTQCEHGTPLSQGCPSCDDDRRAWSA